MSTLMGWFTEFNEETGEWPTHICFGWNDHEERIEKFEGWELPPASWVVPFDPSDICMTKRFDEGFGGNNSPNLCAWSENWVLFSDDYDGAESLRWVPRDPISHMPIRPGGGG